MKNLNVLFLNGRRRSGTLAVLLLMAMGAFATNLNWTFTFSPSDIVLTPNGQYTVVKLADGSSPRDALGAPAMPAKYANILLPDGATDVTVTATGDLVRLASDVTPWPVQRVAPKSKGKPAFTEPDPVVYASASPWPAVAATYEGLHEMQGSTFVSVRVNPVVYVASERALYYRPSVTVTVSYSESPAPRGNRALRNALANEMVNALVVNPAAAGAAPRKAPRDANTVDYLIITNTNLSAAFQNLADYRASAAGGGFSTLVITKETITSTYSGDDVQMKIRNCIIDYKNNHGLTYVVLGGDDTIIPDRDTYVSVGSDTEESHMPTDLYYSDLTGTWKASGNSNYGVVAANVDMSPDVIVGRIPVRTAAQLNGYLAKVQAFEADTETYSRNKIIMGGPSAWDTYTGSQRPTDNVTGDGHAGFRASNHPTVSDSEMWLRRLYRDGIKPYWDNAEEANGRTINLACDYITSWDGNNTCGYTELSASNLKTWLDCGYTHLMFSGHGYPQGWGMEGYSNYSSTQAASQTGLTAIVYTDACLTGAFDGSSISVDGSYYTSEPCLGEAYLRNANGGALAYMGCARYGWGSPDEGAAENTSDGGPSTVYAYKFYHRLYEADAVASNRTVGQAFAMSKADMIPECGYNDCERWIQFGLNYLGDPALALYPREVPYEPEVPVLDYYQAADGKTGAKLKTALANIIYNRTIKNTNDVWSAFNTTDVRNDGKIWDMFSNTTDYTPVTSSSTFSQEGDSYSLGYAFPQSWFASSKPMLTDLHQIFPTDGFVNGKRASYPFGETDGDEYMSANDFSKLGKCTYPGYTGIVFEPDDEYKGDFARTYFYMVTCYEQKLADWYGQQSPGNAKGGNNEAREALSATLDGTTYPALTPWQVEMLMKWAKEDPISRKETERNAAVYAIQNNRNPFIDFPGLEEYIWGSMKTTAFSYDNYEKPVSETIPMLAVTEDDATTTTAPLLWTACNGVKEYTVQLATDEEFSPASADGFDRLINESFEGGSIPSGWQSLASKVSVVSEEAADGAYSVAFKGSGAYLITPLVKNPTAVSFKYKRTATNNMIWSLDISYATSLDGPWTSIGTVSSPDKEWKTFTQALDNVGSVYLKFTDTRMMGKANRYIDQICVTKPDTHSLISTTTVKGTNLTITGLAPGTTYYARVKGKAGWSDAVSFTTPLVKGDANRDNTIDVGDVTAIINIINGSTPSDLVRKAADVNKDGKVDVGDVTGVINMINDK